ncbi:carboxypeptidase-like protein [Algoriphagus ratkowskyi]|uniref:Carboxypeptidase-like protein n=1 Tax=Algoriphagus ratkowskyi TaxID=57028 RepID=A0A2W7R7M3_9BACT|nr:carboxypeptidase-like regulatory domain-containing protein [Algoriphagus ratkowskyi]PZX56853.1 carboxypeptidase-like protein [Algoriphagus ratkowskyi]TXD79768.1 carboxypeptidase-like regulatory domain-containing protein [Algoriphagus ratkowskyi]
MKRRNLKNLPSCCLFLFFILSPIFLLAQTSDLKGRILDSGSQKFLDEAIVTLSGTSLRNISTGGGYFNFVDLKEGKYTLVINLEGYERYEQAIDLKKKLNLGEISLVKYGAGGTGAALQHSIRATNIIALYNERPNFSGGNMIYGLAPQPAQVEGDDYLDSKWNTATLLLYKDQKLLEGYKIRYNITSNTFELIAPESTLLTALPGLRIQNLVWVDSARMVPRYFVNGMDFLEEGTPISGFFEVLVDGELPLMRRTMAIFKESNYNAALMVGNRNHQIVKRNIYYFLEGKNVIEVPSNRKKLFAVFGENADEMKEYMNVNELSIQDPNTLFKMFTYFNSKFPDFKPITSELFEDKN